MMECRELTNDVLIGPLSSAARTHLETCPACRRRQADAQSIASGLSQLGRYLPAKEDPALVRRVIARLPRSSSRPRRVWPWAAALGGAAAAFLAATMLASPPPLLPNRPEVIAVPAPAPVRPVLEPTLPPSQSRPVEAARPMPEAPKAHSPTPPAPPVVARAPEPPGPAVPAPPAPPLPSRPEPRAEPTRPARSVMTLAGIEGTLEVQMGETWKKVVGAGSWEDSVALRSADRPARFVLPEGTRATLRPHCEMRLLTVAPPSIELGRGEAFFEVVPGAGHSLRVLTPDACVQVTGTQFSVLRTDHTEVYVSAGEVKVNNDKGEVLVAAGSASSVRRGAPPARPRPVDVDHLNAWHREMDGVEATLFRYDFEDGRLPLPWSTGKVVKSGPPRGLNVYCLQGSPGIDANLVKMDKRVTTMRKGVKLRFRYWTTGLELMWVQLSCVRIQDNFRFELRNVAPGKWETVEIPLSAFFRLADGSHPQEGDRFTWFNISVAGAAEGPYFDDLELVEIQK